MGPCTRRRFLAAVGGTAAVAGRDALTLEAPAPLRQRPIPISGELLPVIGLGTYEVFDVPNEEAALAPLTDVLSALVAHGGRVLDSSPMYGRAETTTGLVAGRAGVADRLFYATKVWTRGRREGLAEMTRSLQRMRVATLDLMQIHNLLDWRVHADSLAAWKQEGRIRYAGITHYHAGAYADLETAMKTRRFDFVQLNYSLLERDAEQRLLPLAAELGIAVLVNRPFAQGVLFQRVRHRPLPAWAAELACTSWAQLFLKFILAHPAVTCAIPATAKRAHLLDNLGAARGPLPTATEREKIAQLLAED